MAVQPCLQLPRQQDTVLATATCGPSIHAHVEVETVISVEKQLLQTLHTIGEEM
jgi:hypothetical protein